jgi:hypothetical protein
LTSELNNETILEAEEPEKVLNATTARMPVTR